MQINGLPLHPLVVHAAVVFGPLAALAALLHVAVPRWRDRLRWPMLVLAVVAVVAIVAAYVTGRSFLSTRPPELRTSPQVLTHEHLARQLLWITLAFGLVAILAGWLASRTGVLRVVVDGLLGVGAVVVLVWLARTGDAGARAVWG